MARNETKFKVIQKPRKLVAYYMTDSEIDHLGSMGRVEQVLLNALFTAIGFCGGTAVTLMSGVANSWTWAALLFSLIAMAVFAAAYAYAASATRGTKSKITSHN